MAFRPSSAVTVLFVGLLYACNEAPLTGDGGKSDGNAQSSGGTEEAALGTSEEDALPPPKKDGEAAEPQEEEAAEDPKPFVPATPDEHLLASCLAQWGDSPFTAEEVRKARILTKSHTGLGGIGVIDTAKTGKPSLILVKVANTGIGSVEIILKNPNGWYCIQSQRVGIGSFVLRTACGANVAQADDQSTGIGGSRFEEAACE